MTKISLSRLIIVGVLMASMHLSVVAVELRTFADVEQEQRFNFLAKELRCLVCQNQTLADSDADLAKDLREQIYTMLQKGASDTEILDYMVVRYGDFVLYSPPVKNTTLLLWFGPFILIGMITLVLVIYILKRSESKTPDAGNDGQRKKRIQAMMHALDNQHKDNKVE